MNPEIIHHWQSYFGGRTLAEHAIKHPNGMLDRRPPAPGVASKPVAIARVSGSVWIADCPKPGCGGAEMVNFDEPLFFCCACRNVDSDHRPLKVKLPTAQQRGAIEAVLLKREDARTRNWQPGETVDDLKVENLTRGVAP